MSGLGGKQLAVTACHRQCVQQAADLHGQGLLGDDARPAALAQALGARQAHLQLPQVPAAIHAHHLQHSTHLACCLHQRSLPQQRGTANFRTYSQTHELGLFSICNLHRWGTYLQLAIAGTLHPLSHGPSAEARGPQIHAPHVAVDVAQQNALNVIWQGQDLPIAFNLQRMVCTGEVCRNKSR